MAASLEESDDMSVDSNAVNLEEVQEDAAADLDMMESIPFGTEIVGGDQMEDTSDEDDIEDSDDENNDDDNSRCI